jgi:hemolysin III
MIRSTSAARNDDQEDPVRVPNRHSQSQAELIADGIVHGVGVAAGLVGTSILLSVAARDGGTRQVVVAGVYAFGLLTMLSCSAAYNVLRGNPHRGVLRELDHIAIYVMIAGTYTPFLTQLKGMWAVALTSTMWGLAVTGILLKLLRPNLIEAVSVALYLALGWIGTIAFWPLAETLEPTTLMLLAIGGVMYSVGVVFHVLENIPFSNAIWHAFVLSAALVHYVAVVDTVRAR